MQDTFVRLMKPISITSISPHKREREGTFKLQLRVLILGVVLSINVFGGRVERYNHTSKVVPVKSCKNSKNCPVKEFKQKTFDYKAFLSSGQVSSGSAAYTSFQTQNIQQLKNYGIVQLIRGCHFESKLENGKVKKLLSRARHFFGNIVKYKHPKWVVDSIDLDPVYGSYNGHRQWSYRWNEVFGSTAEQTERYLMEQEPAHPLIYVSDYPGTAFEFAPNEAMNISLQFKTCLYDLDDVSLVGSPTDFDLSKALACTEWNSSFIFNHKTRSFESPSSIDPFCLE